VHLSALDRSDCRYSPVAMLDGVVGDIEIGRLDASGWCAVAALGAGRHVEGRPVRVLLVTAVEYIAVDANAVACLPFD
jgi:hypothetical protein